MRLPPLELEWRPEWAGKSIRTDQLYCLYGLTNWCKTDEHLPLPEGLVVEIATKFIFHDIPPPGKYSGLISNLKEPEHQLASQLHDILESHQDIKFYFRDKAFRFHNQHEGREITESVLLRSIDSFENVLTNPIVLLETLSHRLLQVSQD